MMKNKLIPILIILIIIPIVLFFSKDKDPVKINDFRLESFDSDRFYYSDHFDKKVVLVFYATWCNICKRQMKDFERFSLYGKNVELYAVCIDPENTAEMLVIINELDLSYKTLLDKNAEFFKKSGFNNVPATLILNKGEIIYRREGYNSNHLRTVESILEKSE